MQLVLHFLSSPAPVLWLTVRELARLLPGFDIHLPLSIIFIFSSLPQSLLRLSFFSTLSRRMWLLNRLVKLFFYVLRLGQGTFFFNSSHMAPTGQIFSEYLQSYDFLLQMPFSQAGGTVKCESILGLWKQRCQFLLDWEPILYGSFFVESGFARSLDYLPMATWLSVALGSLDACSQKQFTFIYPRVVNDKKTVKLDWSSSHPAAKGQHILTWYGNKIIPRHKIVENRASALQSLFPLRTF